MAKDHSFRYDWGMSFSIKETLFLRVFSITKIPLLYAAGPKVVSLSDEACVISLPFRRGNKNHLGSMYFGALCIGADAAGGLIAAKLLRELKTGKGSLIFKDFKAEFLKRAEGETFFSCTVGSEIKDAVEKAASTGERVELPVPVTAMVPSKFGSEPVAKFVLTLSLKVKRSESHEK
jgi:acyl-coenzyme A thioesterase PaaI-like protein